jgi:replication-associated recombination protein RarA
MNRERRLPLSEILRPKTVHELTLPDKYILRLQMMIDSQDWANMLFVGGPGTGKTSAARILLQARGGYGTLTVDGSNETGVEK